MGIYAKNVVIWVIGRKSMREAGMIRFVRMTCFPRIRRLFFIRKAADSVVKVRTIRFVGLPFVFANPWGRGTDA